MARARYFRAWEQTFAAQKADAISHNFQNATTKDVPLLFGIGAQKPHDQIGLFQACIACDLGGAGKFAQFIQIQRIHL